MISGDKSEKIYYVSSKNRIAAGLLCLLGLIGIAGIHRMYVGKWKTGILFSLTFGIFFIGTLYDICMIYCESFKDADGFPLFAPSSVKSNYRLREPKEKPGNFKVFIAVFSVFISMMSLFTTIYVNSFSTTKQIGEENKLDNHEDDKERGMEKKKSLEQSEMSLVEMVKENYKAEKYSEASTCLMKLKHDYPDSTYIVALEHDYPDIEEKAKAEADRRKQEYEAAMEAFNEEMSNGPCSALYEGYKADGIKFYVFVNSYWYSLTEGDKKAFTEIAYNTCRSKGLNAPFFYVVNINTYKKVARYNSLWGASIDD